MMVGPGDDDLSPLILRYSGTVLRTELVEIGLAWTSNPLATRHTEAKAFRRISKLTQSDPFRTSTGSAD